MSKKPVLLCILDGFGIGEEGDKFNAIAQAKSQAKMPNWQRILKTYPHSKLTTSGLAVGLPEGQIGNSEVGHMTIGAGRVIYQDLPRINRAIADGSLLANQELQALIKDLKQSKKTCHLLGLASDGGVHSHLSHIEFLAKTLVSQGIRTVIHCFLDGRDVAQKSAIGFLQKLSGFEIATVCGRYFAMDRDKKWDRIALATDAIVFGKTEKSFLNAVSVVEEAYKNKVTDEFVIPATIGNYGGIAEEDALIFCNFRADRVRQISSKLFSLCKFSRALSLTHYSEELSKHYRVLFPPQEIKDSLPEILAKNNKTQLRIAETEKYAHVTFFFSCGYEQEFLGEKRILVQSPMVATYDLQPEMSAQKIGENLVKAIGSKEFDFIVANYANPDMVGHSGKLEAAILACEAIDLQLGKIEQEILAADGVLLISADHGNIECMLDDKQQPHTAHTTNPVPLVMICRNHHEFELADGNLSDIAPSILSLLEIQQPKAMTGRSLLS